MANETTHASRIPQGGFYVAITRVKSGSDLYLKGFHPSYIRVNESAINEIQRMEDTKKYECKKTYLDHQVFEAPELEVKVAYLNCNGILHAHHKASLEADHNIMKADLICLAETKLSDACQIEVPNYDVMFRLDVKTGQRMGMLLLQRKDVRLASFVDKGFTAANESFQVIIIEIGNFKFAFVYLHPDYTSQDFDDLIAQVKDAHYVLGDFNTDSFKPQSASRLGKLLKPGLVSLINEKTHAKGGHLDYVLAKSECVSNCYAESFFAPYSDHFAMTVRCALNEQHVLSHLKDKMNIKEDFSTFVQKQNPHKENNSANPKLSKPSASARNVSPRGEVVIKDDRTKLGLTTSDLHRLKAGEWFNNHLIDFYLALIQNANKDCHMFDCTFYNTIEKNPSLKLRKADYLEGKTLLIMPVHRTNHWITVVARVDHSNCKVTVELYDPLDAPSKLQKFRQCSVDFKTFLTNNLPLKITEEDITIKDPKDVPHQSSSSDCGPFLCWISKHLAADACLEFGQAQMSEVRFMMKREIGAKTLMAVDKIHYSSKAHRLSSNRNRKQPVRTFKNIDSHMCFVNASIQILLRAHDLKPDQEWHSPLGIALLQHQQSSFQVKVDASDIREIVSVKGTTFASLISGNQDVREFFDSLNVSEAGDQTYPWSDVSKDFLLTKKTTLQCSGLNCNYRETIDSETSRYMQVMLSCADIKRDKHSPTKPLQDIGNWLEQHTELNIQKSLQPNGFCPRQHPLHKTIQLTDMPDFLLISLDRIIVRNAEGGGYLCRRDDIEVTPPLSITIQGDNDEKVLYRLFGLIEHQGQISPRSGACPNGHYVAQVLMDDGWYHISDSEYSKITTNLGSPNLSTKAVMFAFTKNYVD